MSSVYNLYPRDIMEAVRQLTVEEASQILCDLALSLRNDTLRDVSLCKALGATEPVRPIIKSWEALVHALRTAGIEVHGYGGLPDLVEALGEEAGESVFLSMQETSDLAERLSHEAEVGDWTNQEARAEFLTEYHALMMRYSPISDQVRDHLAKQETDGEWGWAT